MENDRDHYWNGHLYIPCHTVRLSAGPFLPPAMDLIEEHLQIPPDLQMGIRDRYVGGERVYRKGLAAAIVHGDSMIYRHIRSGDIIIFQRWSFEYLEHGWIGVIEKVGDEEGTGSWALKKIMIERPLGITRNEMRDEIDWDSPVIVLRSYNRRIGPSPLDPSGRYRPHGRYLRHLRGQEATLVDSEEIRRKATGKE